MSQIMNTYSMAIDVQETPITYIHGGDLPAPRIPRTIDTVKAGEELKSKPSAEVYWSQMEQLAEETVVKIKDKYKNDPRVPENLPDMLGDLVFGPFRVKRDSIRAIQHNEEVDDEELDWKSRIQANMTHAIVYASRPTNAEHQSGDGQFTQTTYDIAAYFENMSTGMKQANFAPEIRTFWEEIKTRVAVIRALQSDGYTIHLPDYTKDPFDPEAGENEVLTWAKAGIDFAAEKGGKFFLVNCRGEEFYGRQKSGPYKIERSNAEVFFESDLYASKSLWAQRERAKLPQSIAKYVEDTLPRSVHKALVTVPTGSNHLSGLEPTAKLSGRGIRELPRFARFDDQVAQAIQRDFAYSEFSKKAIPVAA